MVKSSSPEQSPRDADVKSAFRKPSGDAATRKYRRRSPAESPSPPAAGSPNGDHSPDARRRDRGSNMKRTDDYRRHGVDRDSRRTGEIRRHGGDYSHRRRCLEDVDSNYHPLRSSRESGHRSRIGYLKQRSDHDRRDAEKHSRDQLDERTYRSQGRDRDTRDRHRDRDGGRDGRKAGKNFLGEEKYDPASTYEESRMHHHDLASSGRSDSPRAKDSHGNSGYLDSEKEGKRKAEEKKYEVSKEYNYRESDSSRKEENNASYGKDSRKDKFVDTNSKVDSGSSGKRTKTERVSGFSEGPLLSKFSTFVEGNQMPCPQEPTDGIAKSLQVTSSASGVEIANDLNAAKVAAMKAAELVNKNIVGCGILSTDQKKKLLWGNKKSTSTVELPGNRWDTSLIGDKERQEKFNKLMGVKGDVPPEKPASDKDLEQQNQVQLELEKQYTAGLRRRDGRTVGLGL